MGVKENKKTKGKKGEQGKIPHTKGIPVVTMYIKHEALFFKLKKGINTILWKKLDKKLDSCSTFFSGTYQKNL